jgi:ATP-dependent helicase/nuclease subunit A
MSDHGRAPDYRERDSALDTSRSFIVQAPAGSGKTELLIQRYLALLGGVERPEEIAAITFTIKAAAEMRQRVFAALRSARNDPRPEAAHEARTWDLARAALLRNDELGWKLEESAGRLCVQTIDALCMSLTRQMPVLSQFGALPEVIEDASMLFAEAARDVLAMLEGTDEQVASDVARLLEHLDNDTGQAEELIATLLAQRDHWMRTLGKPRDRASLESSLDEVRRVSVEAMHSLLPPGLAVPPADDIDGWIAIAKDWLINEGEWRQTSTAPAAVRGNDELKLALREVRKLPPARYSEEQWAVLDAILRLSPVAVAQLRVVFAKHGKADFAEFSQGALRALGAGDEPTDLMLVLDYRIRHILVDEFQDTSHSQFALLGKLTSGWEPGDGRTLFLVGDPMQSIYRFREAEVALFLRAWEEGIGSVSLVPLTLSANFRSQAGLIDWVNESFGRIMPREDDIHGGAVAYSPSHAVHPAEDEAVKVHAFFDGDAAGEGRRIAQVAAAALAEPGRDPAKPASVAILVRKRSHLAQVLPQLREAGIAYRAVEIESLGERAVVRDLLALTRAISHLADRIAWLAVLRAPWCGLTLADILVLGADKTVSIREAMADDARMAQLSPDGLARMQRTHAILSRAIAQRRRSSLRIAVEAAWLALGGPACVQREVDLEDAEIYLDHLETLEEAGALGDLVDFERSVTKLYALPDLEAPECLQVMTIHKAKGLEFDTVIVPGLAGTPRGEDRKLFLWMETPESSLLLSPINPTGTDQEEIHKLVHALDKSKAEHELGRLLYVAATRARRRLHLLGDVELDQQGIAKDPAARSLLRKLWIVVAPEFGAPQAQRTGADDARRKVPVARQGELRRLAMESLRYEAPPAVEWDAPAEAPERDDIEFSWVGDTARRVGSVVHRWLQRIADDEARGWTRARIDRELPAIMHELTARGVVEGDLATASKRVIDALASSLEDPRGKWLLGPQPGARNEYRISTVIDGVRHDLAIDRWWEDLAGAWIVDYKTSTHQGADLEGFLAGEEDRYRGQLERYAVALARPGARRGLYFPLLKGWREWT